MQGIIPRSIHKVIEVASNLQKNGWKYTLDVSFVEIYREELRDLLVSSSDNLAIKQVHAGVECSTKVYVPSLTKKTITLPCPSSSSLEASQHSHDQIDRLITIANQHRAKAATNMNEHSSRSHFVFTLYLKGTNAERKTKLLGTHMHVTCTRMNVYSYREMNLRHRICLHGRSIVRVCV